jgi:hypothetical protein
MTAQLQPNGQLSQRWNSSWRRLTLKLAFLIFIGIWVLGIFLDLTGTDRDGLTGRIATAAVFAVAIGLGFPAETPKRRVLTVLGAFVGVPAAFALVWLVRV